MPSSGENRATFPNRPKRWEGAPPLRRSPGLHASSGFPKSDQYQSYSTSSFNLSYHSLATFDLSVPSSTAVFNALEAVKTKQARLTQETPDDLFETLNHGKEEARINALRELTALGDARLEEFLSRTLKEVESGPWLFALIDSAEKTDILEENHRRAVAASLLAQALRLRDTQEAAGEHSLWSAIRRFASLAEEKDAPTLLSFIRPEDRGATRQVALQALLHIFETSAPTLEAPTLQIRVCDLAKKYLDPDWLITPTNNVLAMNCFCAAAVMHAPELDDLTDRLLSLGKKRLVSQCCRRLSRSLKRRRSGSLDIIDRCIQKLRREP